MLPKITVLYTSAGGLGYPSHVGCLRAIKERKIKIVGTAQGEDAAGLAFVDVGYAIPKPCNVDYIDVIFEICKEEKVQVVIPAAPQELVIFAQAKDRFEQNGIKMVISPLESLRVASNKYLLYKYCNKESIPTPKYFMVRSNREFKDAVLDLGYPQKGICFKPVVSSGSRGFRILTTKTKKLDLLLADQPDGAFVTFEDICALFDEAKEFPELMVMEYLTGNEYSVDVVVDNGKALVVVPRIREKVILGASFIGSVVKHEEIIKYSEQVTSGLKLHGAVGMQFKLDSEGIPKILEVNARPHGALMLSVAAGVNILYLAIKVALGEGFAQPKIRWGTRMLRFYNEIYEDEKGNYFEI
jgi:carbamoyl-phosphate synthase large subunit